MDYLQRPSTELAIIVTVIWLVYLIGLASYRLYFHPVAAFPGPKLAGLSKWYEFYYEVMCVGRCILHIQELHKQYGPIVRVTPDELHVDDSDYWEQLYSQSARYDKYEWLAGRFGNNSSVFTTSNHELHRIRRAKVDLLCEIFAKYKDSGRAFDINKAWSAFAGDVICEYAFGFGYNHLESPDFETSFLACFMAMCQFSHLALHFPWFSTLLNALPDKLVDRMNPDLHILLVLQRDLKSKITSISNDKEKNPERPTIFHEVLESDLPPSEKAPQRLGHEAQTVIGAGLTTTAWALSHATFYLLNQPSTLLKLQYELRVAMPDPAAAPPDWSQLEKLPYLSGCIKEAIRLSHGLSARNPRISPDEPMKYQRWVIPAGTPVSMTNVNVHHDEAIYPRSHEFLPERWLGNPRTENGSSLERYLVAFGKGPRACLGINLAYAELHIALATVFRHFTLELYDTDVSDVKLAHDFFLPSPKLDSKGVRVKVKSVNA